MAKCDQSFEKNRTGALVQLLWEGTHVPKVVGLNPGAVYWMVITFSTYICFKNCNDVCLKR